MSFIDTAFATGTNTAATGQQHASPMPMFFLLAMVAVYIFWMWRQQSRKTKGYQQFIESLNKGDEVVTTGGIAGKIARIEGDYVTLCIAKQTEVMVQKPAIASLLPKGTIKALD